MIEIGTLPEPQWITLGKRVERIYSLEWLVLASAQANVLRLSGLEFELAPDNAVQFALRFQQTTWTLDEISTKLVALQKLWLLCARALEPDGDTAPPELHVRRLSAGSPMDLLVWASENWGGLAGTGSLVGLFVYVVTHPEKVASAIPRTIAAWRNEWAHADDAAVRQMTARIRRREFERDSPQLLEELGTVPTDTALSGSGTGHLEVLSAEEEQAALQSLRRLELEAAEGSDEPPD